jgi:hypothetical protein
MDRKKSKQSNKQHGSRRGRVANGDVHLFLHSQVNLTLDAVNVRKLDIALLPSNFDMFLRYAALYQRYRITQGSWRFYALRVVNTAPNTTVYTYPLVVY